MIGKCCIQPAYETTCWETVSANSLNDNFSVRCLYMFVTEIITFKLLAFVVL